MRPPRVVRSARLRVPLAPEGHTEGRLNGQPNGQISGINRQNHQAVESLTPQWA